jgi:hypothetical protein
MARDRLDVPPSPLLPLRCGQARPEHMLPCARIAAASPVGTSCVSAAGSEGRPTSRYAFTTCRGTTTDGARVRE